MLNAMGTLFFVFSRIGLFSFGGGYVMLPLIYQAIQEFGIMSATEFSNLVALSQITPGPIAVNAATYVGFMYAGIPGAAAATIGVTLPSLVLVLTVSHYLNKFKESRGLNAVLDGIRPATVGLLVSAVIFLSETSIFKQGIFGSGFFQNPAVYLNLIPIGIFIMTMILFGRFKLSPIALTIAAGLFGAFVIR